MSDEPSRAQLEWRIEELEARHDKFLQEFWKTNAENERLRDALEHCAVRRLCSHCEAAVQEGE